MSKTKMDSNKKFRPNFSLYEFLVLFCFIVTLSAVVIYIGTWFDCNPIAALQDPNYGKCVFEKNLEKWGQTGDFFGGIINPLVGLTTILLVLRTIRQNQEALDTSKEELKKSSEALGIQSSLMASEHRERAFMRLLDKIAKLSNIEKTFSPPVVDDEPFKVSGTPAAAARDLLNLSGIEDKSDAYSEVKHAYTELIKLHIKAQLPYLLALGSVYQSENDVTAKHMLSIQLLGSTDRLFIFMAKYFIQNSLTNGSASETFGVDNIELLTVVGDMLHTASVLYDGQTKILKF